MSGSARWGRVFAICFLVMLYPSVGPIFHAHLPPGQTAGIALLVAILAATYIGFWWWDDRYKNWRVVTAVVAGLFAVAILLNIVSGAWTINTFLFPLVVAGYAYPPRIAVAAILILTALSVGMSQPAVAALGLPVSDVVAVDVVTLAQVLLVGFGALGVAWLVRTIAELHRARQQLALMAVEQERVRFARDVHDLMGHSLSVITLKGELATQLIATAPEQATIEVRDIVGVARNALREVREAVSGYRQPTLANELAGARTALAAAGIECKIEQSAGALTQEMEAVLGWTVREGVTNILRHSKAKRCSIRISRDDDDVQLDVVDDGVGSASPQVGNGLRGLGERVTQERGRLEAGPLPNQGFRLRVTLPLGSSPASVSDAMGPFDATQKSGE